MAVKLEAELAREFQHRVVFGTDIAAQLANVPLLQLIDQPPHQPRAEALLGERAGDHEGEFGAGFFRIELRADAGDQFQSTGEGGEKTQGQGIWRDELPPMLIAEHLERV